MMKKNNKLKAFVDGFQEYADYLIDFCVLRNFFEGLLVAVSIILLNVILGNYACIHFILKVWKTIIDPFTVLQFIMIIIMTACISKMVKDGCIRERIEFFCSISLWFVFMLVLDIVFFDMLYK